MDAELLDLYSARMKALGARVKTDRPLEAPDASVKRRSPVCGSQLTLDVSLRPDGRVREIGYTARACALSEAATAIVATGAVGASLDELRTIRERVAAMLAGEEIVFPGGAWEDLEILRPAHMVRSRHGSALLPFETAVEAVEAALKATADREAL